MRETRTSFLFILTGDCLLRPIENKPTITRQGSFFCTNILIILAIFAELFDFNEHRPEKVSYPYIF